MNRTSASAIFLSSCMLLSSVNDAAAQARGPSTQDRRSARNSINVGNQERVEIDAWLKRLAGDFRITRTNVVQPHNPCAGDASRRCQISAPGNLGQRLATHPGESAEGIGKCHAIGTGAGVSCRFDFANRDGVHWSTIQVFGVDPAGPGIRLMEVEAVGDATTAVGKRNGDAVSFQLPCPIPIDQPFCSRVTRVSVPERSQCVEIMVTQNWRPGQQAPGGVDSSNRRTEVRFLLVRQPPGANTGRPD